MFVYKIEDFFHTIFSFPDSNHDAPRTHSNRDAMHTYNSNFTGWGIMQYIFDLHKPLREIRLAGKYFT